MPTGARGGAAQHRQGAGVAQQLVVADGERPAEQGQTGRLDPHRMAVGHVHDRLVERHPAGHPVAEPVGDQPGVVGERVRGLPGEPPALEHQLDGQIPVVERHPGLDAGREQRRPPAARRSPAPRVGRPAAAGLHPRPRGGEPVGLHAEIGEQGDVLGHPVVVIDGDLAGRPVGDPAGRCREHVPDGRERPPSAAAPSIWYAAVATPNRKSGGRSGSGRSVMRGGCTRDRARDPGADRGTEGAGQRQDQQHADQRHHEAPAQPAAGADQAGEHAAQHEPEVVELVEPGDQGVDPLPAVGSVAGQPAGRGEGQRRDHGEAGAEHGESGDRDQRAGASDRPAPARRRRPAPRCAPPAPPRTGGPPGHRPAGDQARRLVGAVGQRHDSWRRPPARPTGRSTTMTRPPSRRRRTAPGRRRARPVRAREWPGVGGGLLDQRVRPQERRRGDDQRHRCDRQQGGRQRPVQRGGAGGTQRADDATDAPGGVERGQDRPPVLRPPARPPACSWWRRSDRGRFRRCRCPAGRSRAPARPR